MLMFNRVRGMSYIVMATVFFAGQGILASEGDKGKQVEAFSSSSGEMTISDVLNRDKTDSDRQTRKTVVPEGRGSNTPIVNVPLNGANAFSYHGLGTAMNGLNQPGAGVGGLSNVNVYNNPEFAVPQATEEEKKQKL